MSKSLIIWIIIISLILVVGSYFLVAGGGQKSTSIISYTAKDKNKPEVEAKESFSDMGKMKVTEIKTKEFAIKNIGSKPLQIFDISSSCNCTAGQLVYQGKESKEYGMHAPSDIAFEIAPQTVAKVKVIYRPAIMPVYGEVEREVYMSTNDPKKSKLVFKVKAFVE